MQSLKIMIVFQYVTKLAYLNLVWIVFSLMGFILFGIFPALFSVFYISRKFLMGETSIPVFHTAWIQFRESFLIANVIGLAGTLGGFILLKDFLYFIHVGGYVGFVSSAILLLIDIAYVVIAIYFIPTYVHYDLKPLQYFRQSFLIGFLHPLQTFYILMFFVAILIVFWYAPGFIPFFGVSGPVFIWMWLVNGIFKRIDNIDAIEG